MNVLSVYSMKGGVGKTATAVNLAYELRADGSRVLLMDLDPQGAAAYYFRVDSPDEMKLGKKKLAASKLAGNIRETDFPGLDLLPSSLSYRNIDLNLSEMKRSRGQLRQFLRRVAASYDWVVLDCPPGLTLLAENVFRASDRVAVPVTPSPLSLRTLDVLLDFFAEGSFREDLLYPFFSMIDLDNMVHQSVKEEFMKLYPEERPYIPLTESVERMGQERCPVPTFEPDGETAGCYRALTRALCEPFMEVDQDGD